MAADHINARFTTGSRRTSLATWTTGIKTELLEMTPTKRIARPQSEPGIFTDELPAATSLLIQTEENFFENIRAKAAQRGRRSTQRAVATVSFESVEALLSLLTPKRYELLDTVKRHGKFTSIESLAVAVQRDRSTVSKDLRALAAAGLVRVSEAVSHGHGRRTEITPIARKLTVKFTI
jgi:predicted transcriptional regulator